MTVRRILAAGLLAVGVIAAPGTLSGQEIDVMATIREAVAQRSWMREYLRHYDELLTMQAALGEISGDQADAQLAAAAAELYEQGYHESDLDAVKKELSATADAFLRSLEYEIRTSTTWPDRDTETYRTISILILDYIRADLVEAFALGRDPLPLLRQTTQLLAYARGSTSVPPDLDFFSGARDRAWAALPPIPGMTPAAPPSAVAQGQPPRGQPSGPTIPAGGRPPTNPAGGAVMPPRVPSTTRVVLRGGPVEADVRLVGRGTTDAVGRSRRIRSDGKPDTEIALQLYAPRFMIDWIEIRNEPIEGGGFVNRAANRILGTWSTRPAERRPPIGVVSQGQLLNRQNGSVSGLASDAAVMRLSLFIQDEGQLERSDAPGTLVLHFQGGEAATFTIAPVGSGAPAGPVLTGARPPGTPPVILTSGPPRTPSSIPTAQGGRPIPPGGAVTPPGGQGGRAIPPGGVVAPPGGRTPTGPVAGGGRAPTTPPPALRPIPRGVPLPPPGARPPAVGQPPVAGGQPPVVGGQPPAGGGGVTPGAAAGSTTTWNTNAKSHEGILEKRFSFTCPPNGRAGSLWGTDVYTTDSSICTAAVHAGIITLAAGGPVAIEIREGASGYTASSRYGVTSTPWGAYPRSYVFVGTPMAPPAFAGTIQTDRDTYVEGQPITVTFSGFPATNDWIVLAAANAAAEQYGEWKWTDKKASGPLTFTAPAAGTYEVRAFLDWPTGGHNVRARRPFTVTGATAPPVVGLPPNPPVVGGPTPPTAGTPSRLSMLRASYLGRDRDVVTNGSEAKADSTPDGHFQVQATFDFWQDVTRITMESADASGNRTGGHRWDTQDGVYRLLGVLSNNVILDPTHMPQLGTFSGPMTFDLYASDSDWFKAGNYVVIQFVMGDRQPVETLVPLSDVAVPPTAGQPPAGGQPPTGGGAVQPGAVTTDWTTTPSDHRLQLNKRFSYPCPPNGNTGGHGPFGTDIYTDDSAVCKAAVHAGMITFAGGGTVVIEMRRNPGSYKGSLRNEVQTVDWGSWENAFVFVGAPMTQTGGAGPGAGQPPVGGGSTRLSSYQVAWVGMDDDVVTNDPGAELRKDGTIDAHLRVQAAFSFWQDIEYLALATADASGNKTGRTWHSQNVSSPLLAVLYGKMNLNVRYAPQLGTFNGPVTFDLYAGPSSPFTQGEWLLVEMGMGAGQAVTQLVQVGSVTPTPGAGGAPPVASTCASIYVPAKAGEGVTTPCVLEAGRWYALEATGTIGMWGDADADRVDAVWCYNPPEGWAHRCGTAPEKAWNVLHVVGGDARSLSDLSTAAGGPSPIAYNPGHTYTVRVQGRGAAVNLRVNDTVYDDNSGGFTVRITPTDAPANPPVVGGPTPPTAGTPSRLSMLRASYLGRDRDVVTDVVANGAEAKADGKPDGHFQVQATFDFWQDVTRITMESADASGNRTGGHRWDTQNGAYRLLGVLSNDVIVDPTHVPQLGTFSGPMTFDLYASDSDWFKAGNYVVIEFVMGDRQPVETLVPLSDAGPVAGALPGGTAITWSTTPVDHRGQSGERFPYACPPGGDRGHRLFGTMVYTDDSSVCEAAVHAGLITYESGGSVTIEIRPGRACYYGSRGQGGAESGPWGTWEGSFVFVGPDGKPRLEGEAPNATARAQKESYAPGEPIVVQFSGFPGYPSDKITIARAGGSEEWPGGLAYRHLDARCEGTVEFAARQAFEQPGTYEVRGMFNNADRVVALVPGMETRLPGSDAVRTRSTFTVTEPEPQVPRDLLVSYDATWVGTDDDKVGEWGSGTPNGKRDGHFTYDISINMPYTVRSITVYTSDSTGNRTGTDTWSTRSGAWMLGVFKNGEQLNKSYVDSVGRFRDFQHFDLYADDNNSFNPGQYFTLELVGGPQPLKRTVQIPGVGLPQAVVFAGTIQTDRASYTEGDPITVLFRGFPATADWISLAAAGAPDDQWLQWFWTDGSSTEGRPAGATRADGSLSFAALPAGSYEVRAYADWPAGGTNVRARQPFTVEARRGDNAEAHAQKASYTEGEPIVVEFTGFPGYLQDWIDVAPVGTPDESYGEQHILESRTAGTLQFNGLAPGTYEVRGRFNWPDGGYAIRTRSTFTVSPKAVVFAGTIQTDRASYSEGDPINVLFRGFPATADWIAIAAAGAPDDQWGQWFWTDGSNTEGRPAGTTRTDGSLSFAALPAGSYEVRAYADWPTGGTTVRARQAFTVEARRGDNASAQPERQGYTEGEPIVVQFSGFPGHAQDWIEISPAGAGDESYGEYKYLDGRSDGTLQFQGLAPGTYEVRGRFDWPDGGYAVRTRSTFTVRSNVPPPVVFAGTVRTDRATYTEGDLVTVYFNGFPASNDWIAIAPAGAGDDQYGEWHWTDGSTTEGRPAGAPRTDGSLSFNALAAGSYEVRAFADWPAGGMTVRTRNAFTVEAPRGDNAMAHAQAQGYPQGEPIVVEFGSFPGYAQDWIEISPAGASDESYGEYKYLAGQTGGTLTFNGLTPGTYEVRGRFNWPDGGYAVRTRSTFMVHEVQPPQPPPPTYQYRMTRRHAEWVGIDADVVTNIAPTPDRRPDGHFSLEIALEGSVELRWIRIFSADAQGNPSGGQAWHTQSRGNAILGVVAGGQLMTPDYMPTLGLLGEGSTRLDLYAYDSGYFNPGQHFAVEFGLGDDTSYGEMVQIQAGQMPQGDPGNQGGQPPAVGVDWSTTAAAYQGRNGEQFTYTCPPGGPAGRIYGTTVYTDDSSVCTAAVHAGLITVESGGQVTFEILPGQDLYPGSQGYGGVTSLQWNAWYGSFRLVR